MDVPLEYFPLLPLKEGSAKPAGLDYQTHQLRGGGRTCGRSPRGRGAQFAAVQAARLRVIAGHPFRSDRDRFYEAPPAIQFDWPGQLYQTRFSSGCLTLSIGVPFVEVPGT